MITMIINCEHELKLVCNLNLTLTLSQDVEEAEQWVSSNFTT